MMYKRNKTAWQKKYIREVFNSKNGEKFSKIILKNLDLLSIKDKVLPKKLYKFYAPTSDNILDVKYKRLWMCHPNSFNDPFDCRIGFDRLAFEKDCLLRFIKNNEGVQHNTTKESFTNEDAERISNSILIYPLYYSKREYYEDVLGKILEQKSENFQHEVRSFLYESRTKLDSKVELLNNINIRVACFSELDKYEEFDKKIQMWSHYADNHKGFCVEYDISPLKSPTSFTLEDYDYYGNQDTYLSERMRALIKGGLFSVIYTANRVNIPITKLNKISPDYLKDPKHKSIIDEIIYKSFIVKSNNWSYEKEWRIILDGEICKFYDNKIPFPFIKKIYLGYRMDKKTIDTLLEIGEELGVEVVMMKMNSNKFLLEETYIDKWEKERLKWRNPFYN